MTDDDKMLDEKAARMAENILKGAAYSSGITDLIAIEVPSLKDMLQLAKHKGE
jgi:hypothetical protein